ncbi:hypothetical protein [Pseudothioclava nitratireducens]|uniref:hypothetical protein n=1 Tax=Pseudothioclava nitratireducens TaxID=1928646 RepID=UPI0023DCE1C4|nr:hypothetical protein [Defluviimonas nitratireducens]MDF1621704.1 hypothetical protein [Defluviimonas nitratireducens]
MSAKRTFLAFLVYHVTFGYLLIAIMTSRFTSLGAPLTALRDAWIVLALSLFVLYRQSSSLLFVLLSVLFGLVGSLDGTLPFNALVFLYGLRDVIFLATVVFLLRLEAESFSQIGGMKFFVLICAALSFSEILLQWFGFNAVADAIFASSDYFSAKGIESNVSGGLLGARVTAPLYSASLIATLYASYAFFLRSNLALRAVFFLISLSTLSKVVPFITYFAMFRRFPLTSSLVALGAVFFSYRLLLDLSESHSGTLYSQHIASILDRYNAFFMFPDFEDLIFPRPLGYSSIAGHVLNGLNAADAPESLILSKIYDFGIWTFFCAFFLFFSARRISRRYLAFLISFLFLQLFSSLSNHLVAFVPVIVLLKQSEEKL